jgi:hypothetical protein
VIADGKCQDRAQIVAPDELRMLEGLSKSTAQQELSLVCWARAVTESIARPAGIAISTC